MFFKIAQNRITQKRNSAILREIKYCEWLRKVLFFRATKAKICAFFRKNCAKVLWRKTLILTSTTNPVSHASSLPVECHPCITGLPLYLLNKNNKIRVLKKKVEFVNLCYLQGTNVVNLCYLQGTNEFTLKKTANLVQPFGQL